jgi:uncharacterized NAD-dependent epimerase/dehydratase family protein
VPAEHHLAVGDYRWARGVNASVACCDPDERWIDGVTSIARPANGSTSVCHGSIPDSLRFGHRAPRGAVSASLALLASLARQRRSIPKRRRRLGL